MYFINIFLSYRKNCWKLFILYKKEKKELWIKFIITGWILKIFFIILFKNRWKIFQDGLSNISRVVFRKTTFGHRYIKIIPKNFIDIEKNDFLSKIFRYSKKITEKKFMFENDFSFSRWKNFNRDWIFHFEWKYNIEIDFLISKLKINRWIVNFIFET